MTRPYTSRKLKFTATFIETAKPGTYTDAVCPGLKLRVAKSGQKTFYHQWQLRGRGEVGTRGKRKRGPIRKVGVGHFPVVSLAQARLRVTAQRDEFVDRGRSPVVVEPVVSEGKTFAEVAEMTFFDETNVTTRNDVRDHLLKTLGRRPINQITRREVAAVLDDIGEAAARSRAHRVLGHLKKVFELAFERGYTDDNVTAGMKRRYTSRRRTRVLDLDELRAVWDAAGDDGCGAAVRLMMLTGQRRGEVGGMKWDDVDLDAMVWTSRWQNLKGGTTERGDHAVYLSRQAVDLLLALRARRRDDSGPFVFSVKNGQKPVTGWVPFKAGIDRELPDLPPWVLHELRHTVVSGLADLGVLPHVVSRVVGHTLGNGVSGVTAGYMHADFADEKREAMSRWADHVLPGDDDDVVRLADRRAK